MQKSNYILPFYAVIITFEQNSVQLRYTVEIVVIEFFESIYHRGNIISRLNT
jgi:hypothetical protein